MDKELVFGRKISVNFAQKFDERDCSPYQATPSKHFLPIYHQGFSSSSSRESSPASQKEYDRYENRRHGDTSKCRKRFDFPPPPVIDRIDFPGESHYSTDTVLGSFSDTNARSDNPPAWNNDFFGNNFLKNEDTCSRNSTCSSYSSDNAECGHFTSSQSREQVDNLNFRCLQKNVGRVSPFVMPESTVKSSTWSSAFSVDMPSAGRNNVKPISNGLSVDSSIRSAHGYHSMSHCTGTFNATNRPTEYSNPGLNSHHTPTEISHPIGRANPIISPGFSPTVDLAVTNLDQSFEVNEMKLLLSVFREHVMNKHLKKQRTKQFAADVELLKHTPSCSMTFNKFIPAYHHHFGMQCRVADYGFSKLIELFEAIPDVLSVIDSSDGPIVTLVDCGFIHLVSLRIRWLLMEQEDGKMSVEKLTQLYQKQFGHSINLESFSQDLEDVAFIRDGTISLSPLVTSQRFDCLASRTRKQHVTPECRIVIPEAFWFSLQTCTAWLY